MSDKNSIKNTIRIAFLVCMVCSVVVSFAAVSLKPKQQENQANEVKKSVLQAAGLYDESKSVEEQFKAISTHIVDLKTGKYTDDVDVAAYDQKAFAKDPETSRTLTPDEDIASIKRQEDFSKVYTVEEDGKVKTVILPIRGYGLWSTLYGFIALDQDLNTVEGLGFYEHAETPGLGGEVDNPKWKALWKGKEVYGDEGKVELSVIKGNVNPQNENQVKYDVDGLSGATLTSKGVNNLVHFWMSEEGFRPYLQNLAKGEV